MARLRHHPGHPLADEKGWVELNDDYYTHLPDVDSCGKPYHKSDNASHYIISDIMPDTRHMANGQIYNSKSEFRKVTKSSGCVEVGNDKSILSPPVRKPVELDKRERREAIRRSIYELRNGRR